MLLKQMINMLKSETESTEASLWKVVSVHFVAACLPCLHIFTMFMLRYVEGNLVQLGSHFVVTGASVREGPSIASRAMAMSLTYASQS